MGPDRYQSEMWACCGATHIGHFDDIYLVRKSATAGLDPWCSGTEWLVGSEVANLEGAHYGKRKFKNTASTRDLLLWIISAWLLVTFSNLKCLLVELVGISVWPGKAHRRNRKKNLQDLSQSSLPLIAFMYSPIASWNGRGRKTGI